MPIALTAERVAAVYDCLRTFPPFCRWKLPPSDEVIFHVTRHRDRQGHCTVDHNCKNPEITVSEYWVGTFETLVSLVAHEMIHLHQFLSGADPGPGTQHDAEFRRIAKRICLLFNWDYKQFITT